MTDGAELVLLEALARAKAPPASVVVAVLPCRLSS